MENNEVYKLLLMEKQEIESLQYTLKEVNKHWTCFEYM